MPLMRAFGLWLDKHAPEAEGHELLSIMLECFVRLRTHMTMEELAAAVENSFTALEIQLREGLLQTDPMTLQPRMTVLAENREKLGEVQYRAFLKEIEELEVPDYFPEDLE
jgi:hypothetical protein